MPAPVTLSCPNHDARPAGMPIDTLVLHYTGMPTGTAAISRLRDASAKVSAHYVIEEDGRVFQLVPEERRAWHAGIAYWRGHRDINGRSIGIELVNPGHEFGYRAFPKAQMTALEALARAIVKRRQIPARNVVGHADVAPERKEDPGELFDWERLAASGIGLWPKLRRRWFGRNFDSFDFGPGDRNKTIAETQRRLVTWGYEVSTGGELDARTTRVLVAFQRHFRPSRIDGRLDGETASRLAALIEQID
ncbi:MAG TPA: N-acetylmuramoyl-L-alanine amidase [Alphaproteobacteria bacterium]